MCSYNNKEYKERKRIKCPILWVHRFQLNGHFSAMQTHLTLINTPLEVQGNIIPYEIEQQLHIIA